MIDIGMIDEEIINKQRIIIFLYLKKNSKKNQDLKHQFFLL